jgi:hypothetical protein
MVSIHFKLPLTISNCIFTSIFQLYFFPKELVQELETRATLQTTTTTATSATTATATTTTIATATTTTAATTTAATTTAISAYSRT